MDPREVSRQGSSRSLRLDSRSRPRSPDDQRPLRGERFPRRPAVARVRASRRSLQIAAAAIAIAAGAAGGILRPRSFPRSHPARVSPAHLPRRNRHAGALRAERLDPLCGFVGREPGALVPGPSRIDGNRSGPRLRRAVSARDSRGMGRRSSCSWVPPDSRSTRAARSPGGRLWEEDRAGSWTTPDGRTPPKMAGSWSSFATWARNESSSFAAPRARSSARSSGHRGASGSRGSPRREEGRVRSLPFRLDSIGEIQVAAIDGSGSKVLTKRFDRMRRPRLEREDGRDLVHGVDPGRPTGTALSGPSVLRGSFARATSCPISSLSRAFRPPGTVSFSPRSRNRSG